MRFKDAFIETCKTVWDMCTFVWNKELWICIFIFLSFSIMGTLSASLGGIGWIGTVFSMLLGAIVFVSYLKTLN
jgi:hypothetical protein